MDVTPLIKTFAINDHIWKRNLEGVSHAESLIQPAGGGNGINWVAGHTVLTRDLILGFLGRDPIWEDAGKESIYRRGQTLVDAEQAAPFEEILERWDRAQPQIIEGLQAIPAEQLAAASETDIPGETVGEDLAFLQFHETYHLGQLGLLRRIVGKPGAIA